MVFGKCHLVSPSWCMNNQALKISEELEYLGATLSNNANSHVLKRVQKCRQAFYVLQGAGMCKDGVNNLLSLENGITANFVLCKRMLRFFEQKCK